MQSSVLPSLIQKHKLPHKNSVSLLSFMALNLDSLMAIGNVQYVLELSAEKYLKDYRTKKIYKKD